MTLYIRLIIIFVLLAGLGVQDWWVYNKGKDSVIKSVVSGVATTAAKQDKQETVDLQKATDVTKQLASLEAKNRDLTKKLQASVQADPRANCVLSPDELSALQSAAGSTK